MSEDSRNSALFMMELFASVVHVRFSDNDNQQSAQRGRPMSLGTARYDMPERSREGISKACLQHPQTVLQPCMWFMEEPRLALCGPNSTEPNLFHHGETTYGVG